MVEASSYSGDSARVPTIGDLIQAELDAGKSVRDLSAASGYRVKHQTFQELSKQRPKQFPKESKTVAGMAQALNCTESAVVLAYAAGLGIAVDSMSEFSLRMPPGVDDLPPEMKNALVSVVRAAVKQTKNLKAPETAFQRKATEQGTGSKDQPAQAKPVVRRIGSHASSRDGERDLLGLIARVAAIDPILDMRDDADDLKRTLTPVLDVHVGRMAYLHGLLDIIKEASRRLRDFADNPELSRAIAGTVKQVEAFVSQSAYAAASPGGARQSWWGEADPPPTEYDESMAASAGEKQSDHELDIPESPDSATQTILDGLQSRREATLKESSKLPHVQRGPDSHGKKP